MSSVSGPAPRLPAAVTMVPVVLQDSGSWLALLVLLQHQGLVECFWPVSDLILDEVPH